jgi:predicted DNA-binding transcriptional regulator YafY
MSNKLAIKRIHLIISKLRANPCSFADLETYLEKSSLGDDNYSISKRTFDRDVIEIFDIYQIKIEYCRSENVYKIAQEANEGKTNKIIESFQIYNALSLSDAVSKSIIIEKRKPLGTENLHLFIHAIQNNLEVHFSHEKFWESSHESKSRTLYPLALKEARNRWYLVGQDSNDNTFKSFGLDRISNVDITSKKFEYPNNFDPEEKYEHAFGIITDGTAPEKIKLCFSNREADYIKSLPLHHSQKIVSENETECIIELHLSPTYDFVMELLSIGKEVKVLEPESLKIEMMERLEATIKHYK